MAVRGYTKAQPACTRKCQDKTRNVAVQPVEDAIIQLLRACPGEVQLQKLGRIGSRRSATTAPCLSPLTAHAVQLLAAKCIFLLRHVLVASCFALLACMCDRCFWVANARALGVPGLHRKILKNPKHEIGASGLTRTNPRYGISNRFETADYQCP